jgi:hypothetical protein
MIRALLRSRLRGHFRTDGKPRKIDYSALVTAPLAFLAFIVILIVLSNSMPTYSNGTRMGIIDGATAIYEGEAKPTVPFEEPGPESTTLRTQPPEEVPINWMTETPIAIGALVGLNRESSIVIVAIAVLMVFSLAMNAFQVPFVPVERKLNKDAFKPKISNAALSMSLTSMNATALLVCLAYAAVLIVGGMNLLTTDPGEDGVVFMGLALHPIMLLGIGLLMIRPIRYAFSSRRFLSGLLSRRCDKCYHMDTTRVIDKEYVRTDVTTTTYYQTKHYSNGGSSRRKTGESTSSHDVYKYTYECANCGHRFRIQQ